MTERPRPAQLTVADLERALDTPWARELDRCRRVGVQQGDDVVVVRAAEPRLIDGVPWFVLRVDSPLWADR